MNKKYPCRINLYVEKDLYDFLTSRAKKSERSLSNYARALFKRIKQIIEEEEKETN